MSIKVESTAIETLEFTQILEVKFKNGPTYVYTGVPAQVYKKFVNSNSKGRFFQENILDRYECEKR